MIVPPVREARARGVLESVWCTGFGYALDHLVLLGVIEPDGRIAVQGARAVGVLVFLSPAGFENFFFEVGHPARPGEQAPPLGPEELERTIAAAPSYGMELHLPDGA